MSRTQGTVLSDEGRRSGDLSSRALPANATHLCSGCGRDLSDRHGLTRWCRECARQRNIDLIHARQDLLVAIPRLCSAASTYGVADEVMAVRCTELAWGGTRFGARHVSTSALEAGAGKDAEA